MDNINNFIDNFSARDRIKFSGNKLFIKSLGTSTTDLITFGSSILIVILIFIAYNYFYGASIIYLVLAIASVYLLFFYLGKGDNEICIDLLKRKITFQRRPQIFKFIPSRIISFAEIDHFGTSEDITELEATLIKEYVVYLTKNIGLLKKVTLISFDQSERNNASQLLSFFKKAIVQPRQ